MSDKELFEVHFTVDENLNTTVTTAESEESLRKNFGENIPDNMDVTVTKVVSHGEYESLDQYEEVLSEVNGVELRYDT